MQTRRRVYNSLFFKPVFYARVLRYNVRIVGHPCSANAATSPGPMTVSIVLAVSNNRIIGTTGKNGAPSGHGGMPWRLPDDLKNFRNITIDKPVIMGRCTWETLLDYPLKRRRCIVLTSRTSLNRRGCEIAKNPDEALALCADNEEVMVIGGARVFEAFWERAERLYLTRIEAEVGGDVYLPNTCGLPQGAPAHEKFHPADDQHHYAFRCQEFELGRRRC